MGVADELLHVAHRATFRPAASSIRRASSSFPRAIASASSGVRAVLPDVRVGAVLEQQPCDAEGARERTRPEWRDAGEARSRENVRVGSRLEQGEGAWDVVDQGCEVERSEAVGSPRIGRG